MESHARGPASVTPNGTVVSDQGTRLRGPYYKLEGKTSGAFLYPVNSSDPFLFTPAYWQQYKDMGYNSVRFVVAWGTHSYPNFSKTVTLQAVDDLVAALTSLDMYVTICGSSSNFATQNSTYHLVNLQDQWNHLAPRYANNPNVLYEIQNEPMGDPNGFRSTNWSPPWGDAHELIDVYHSVRAMAPDTIIGMWGFSTLGGATNSAVWAINSPEGDPNHTISYAKTAVVFHYYPKSGDTTAFPGYITTLKNSFPAWMTESSDTQTTTDGDLNYYLQCELKAVSWYAFEMQQGLVNGKSGTMLKCQSIKTYLEANGYGWTPDVYGLPGGTFEAEDLEWTTSGKSTTVVADTGASGGQYVQYNSSGTQDWIQFKVPNVAEGTYAVKVRFRSGEWNGIGKLQVDGWIITSPGTIDMYGSPAAYSTASMGNKTWTATADHYFKFQVTGKNAASSGYNLRIDSIQLLPVTTYEAESLPRTTSGEGTTIGNSTTASGGQYVQFNSNGTQDWIDFTLPEVQAGTYTVKIRYRKTSAYAVGRLQVDGWVLGVQTVDQYNATEQFVTTTMGTKTWSANGPASFKFTVWSKNTSSSGYLLSLDSIILEKQ